MAETSKTPLTLASGLSDAKIASILEMERRDDKAARFLAAWLTAGVGLIALVAGAISVSLGAPIKVTFAAAGITFLTGFAASTWFVATGRI